MNDLKHLQQVLLGMMKEIDSLCARNNIPYFLIGGNAIGTERHNGFIPWDDDFDISLFDDDYFRFLEACRNQLPADKWIIQEGGKDWPYQFSKLRLRGTFIEDVGEWHEIPHTNRGIFIDVFRMTNASPNGIERRLQYFCDKILISHALHKNGYKTDSRLKQIILGLSGFLDFKPINRLFNRIVYRYQHRDTGVIGRFFNDVRYKSCFMPKEIWGTPVRKKYEDTMLPVAENNDKYLTLTFGDYMKLPPEDQRIPKHSLNVDFGKY